MDRDILASLWWRQKPRRNSRNVRHGRSDLLPAAVSVCQLPFSWWSLLACWTSARFRAQKSIGLMKQISIHLISWPIDISSCIYFWYLYVFPFPVWFRAGWLNSSFFRFGRSESILSLGARGDCLGPGAAFASHPVGRILTQLTVNLMNSGAWWSLFARLHGFFNGVRLHGKQS